MARREAVRLPSPSVLERPGPGRRLVSCRKHDTLFAQGDPADAVFYILEGKVKLAVASRQGKEAVVAILGPGDFVGEGCLAGQPVRMAAAIAMTSGTCVRIGKKFMAALLRQRDEFSERFTAYLLRRNIRIEEDLIDQLFNTSEKRLARALLLLAQIGREGKPAAIVPRISQETLAEIVGTTRARVSHFMNKFRRLGLIDYNGGLSVHSALLNVVLHDRSLSRRLPG